MTTAGGDRAEVAVVGGGIAGLTSAYRLRQHLGPAARIEIFEADAVVGGKLRAKSLSDNTFIDVGAEAFLVRRPEVLELVEDLGLADQVVNPAGRRPLVWVNGAAVPLPERTLLGIPSAPGQIDRLVDEQTRERIVAEPSRPLNWIMGGDISIGDLVEQRFGRQVVERSVDPLIGGVYSGSAYSTGVRAALPALAAALDAGAVSLTAATQTAASALVAGPLFGALRGGYAELTAALDDRTGAVLSTGAQVNSIDAVGSRWRVDGRLWDAVVVATPASVAGTLVASFAPQAASHLASIESASSAVVVVQLPPTCELPDDSGVLVATGESLRVKAFTFVSRKWPHLEARLGPVVRCSLGRFGEPLPSDDRELVEVALGDLSTVLGSRVSPIAVVVQRWPDGLPQYSPGHVVRIAAIRDDLVEYSTLALAGNYLQGVGVAATIATANDAAFRIAAALG